MRTTFLLPLVALSLVACTQVPADTGTDSSSSAVSSVVTDAEAPVRNISPAANEVVTSPLTVRGEAVGPWYFEASFPVKLLDANGNQLAITPLQAQGEWMTTDYVPFEGTLAFTAPTTATGMLVFEKDNPSGLPENDASITLPVRFVP